MRVLAKQNYSYSQDKLALWHRLREEPERTENLENRIELLSDLGQGSDFKKCVCWGGGVPACPTACV